MVVQHKAYQWSGYLFSRFRPRKVGVQAVRPGGPTCMRGRSVSSSTWSLVVAQDTPYSALLVAWIQRHRAQNCKGESLHGTRTARTLRATFRLRSPQIAPRHAP